MVMQLNIPKLGTAMYRIPSGFMNCIHKTRCGQCNGCHLPFINGSLKWLRSHWRFMLWASILSKPYTLLNAARVWHYLLSSHLFNSAFFPAATLWMPDIQLRNVWYSDSKNIGPSARQFWVASVKSLPTSLILAFQPSWQLKSHEESTHSSFAPWHLVSNPPNHHNSSM